MNETSAPEPFAEELLSAYLDGELSPEQRELVEQHLEGHPESRQLLDELAALQMSLVALPKHQLPGNFHESVLRQAERDLLSAPEAAATPPLASEPNRRHQLLLRAVVYPLVAVAAAIVIMVLSQGSTKNNNGQYDVALHDSEDGTVTPPPKVKDRQAVMNSTGGEDEAEVLRPLLPGGSKHGTGTRSVKNPRRTKADQATADTAKMDTAETESIVEQTMTRAVRLVLPGKQGYTAFEQLLERQQLTLAEVTSDQTQELLSQLESGLGDLVSQDKAAADEESAVNGSEETAESQQTTKPLGNTRLDVVYLTVSKEDLPEVFSLFSSFADGQTPQQLPPQRTLGIVNDLRQRIETEQPCRWRYAHGKPSGADDKDGKLHLLIVLEDSEPAGK